YSSFQERNFRRQMNMANSTLASSPFADTIFDRLDSRFQKNLISPYSIFASIGGRRLELRFPSKNHAAIIEQCVGKWLIPKISAPDALFCFWADDCSSYIYADYLSERCRFQNKNGWILYAPGACLIGANVSANIFYNCQHLAQKQTPIPYWALSTLANYWAGTVGLLPLHGGAVGIRNNGVLLAAKGGGGKSTLAASCLSAGIDYIADDYLLADMHGPLRVMPLFSTLKLHQDMKAQLKLELPIIWSDASRRGKQVLDASSLPLRHEMLIHAVVFLHLEERDDAVINAVPPGSIAIRLIQTMLQTAGLYDPAIAKIIVKRLSKIPAYDMILSRKLDQNVETLRRLIERMK
ncbi:MAG: hypothetical protein NC400_02815, partial [Clostridium sp.]|nr:hypothetical protein [Clostridium sp.]